jgi:hypothetical protein
VLPGFSVLVAADAALLSYPGELALKAFTTESTESTEWYFCCG